MVNITSVAGSLAAPERSFCGSTKAVANHPTRFGEGASLGVRVNAVVPGPVYTPIYYQLARPRPV